MPPTTKLTKRQKKGIAFRQRKHSKGSKDEAPGIVDDLEDDIDVPSLGRQALVDGTQGLQGHQVSKEALVGKGKARAEGDDANTRVVVAATKKRKAGQEAEGIDKPKPKRRKGPDGGPLDDMEQPAEDQDEDGDRETGKEGEKAKQRFILFLGTYDIDRSRGPPHCSQGNLRYTTTPEVIQAHFSTCGVC